MNQNSSILPLNRKGREAFTLIELMVASSVLVVIVLMVASVFRQSSLAWDAGMESAQGNMTARTVLNSIQSELALAVNATNYFEAKPIEINNSSITFIALDNKSTDPDLRSVRKIKYELSDGNVKRTETTLGLGGPGKTTTSTIARNINSLTFNEHTTDEGKLPLWVTITLKYSKKSAMYSSLCAYSLGPNGLKDGPADPNSDKDNDDIYGW